MSPIFVRPVREQLEHDRLIRQLVIKYKRKFDVVANVGDEQLAPVKIGKNTFFPDLVLTDGKKLAGVIEIESGESVNNLEAMAQWVHFARSKVPFHLYVPVQGYDAARRLCDTYAVAVSEIWTYRPLAEDFDLVRMFNDPNAVKVPRQTAAAADGKSAAPEKKLKPAAAKSAPGVAKNAAAKTTGAKSVKASKAPSGKAPVSSKTPAKGGARPVKKPARRPDSSKARKPSPAARKASRKR
ncbi:MAG: hypothetical protein ABI652_03775 [Acidobacteriota bacterium]